MLASFDPRKLFDDAGDPKPIGELDDETAYAIQGLDVEDLYEHFGKGQAKLIGKIKKYKVSEKTKNLELIGRHLRMFADKLEIEDVTAERVAERLRRVMKKRGGTTLPDNVSRETK